MSNELTYIIKNIDDTTHLILQNDYIISDFSDVSLDDILCVINGLNIVFNKKGTIVIKCVFTENFNELTCIQNFMKFFDVKFDYCLGKMNSCDMKKNVIYKLLSDDNVKLYDEHNNDISCKLVKRDNGIYFKPTVTSTYHTNIECEIYNYTGVNHICDKNVYLINLHTRYYNYPRSHKLLQSICVDNKRFEAIDGNNGEYDEMYEQYVKSPFTELEKRLGRKALISKGALGCLLSMKTIFEYALRDNAKYLCVVEDDIMIKKMFDFEKVSNAMIKTSGFNILRFGSSDRCIDECELANEDFYDCTIESNGGFFNIYNKDAIKYYYDMMCKHDTPLDLSTRDHIGNKCHVVFPNLIIANLDHVSSITGLVRTHQYSIFKWNPEEFDYE